MTDRPNREGLLLPILIPLGALVLIGLVLFGFSRILLSTSADAATGVALVVAVAIMVTASVIASRRRQPNGVLFSLFGVVAGVAMVAGGVAVLAFAPSEEGEAFAVTLAAPPNAAVDGFRPTDLSVPSGEAVSLEFDNQDPGIQHNVVVFGGEDDSAPALVEGTIITGVASETVALEPLEPGSYFFHCEVHPTTMTGTIEASEGGGGGGEGGGRVVVASGLAFDTDEIDLPADEPTDLTFDNRDPSVVHNIAIFPSEDALDDPLFDGADVTGPAEQTYQIPALPEGTYYFHCDTHPNMSGSVVVAAGGGGGGGGGEGGGGPPPTGATGASGASGTSGASGPSG